MFSAKCNKIQEKADVPKVAQKQEIMLVVGVQAVMEIPTDDQPARNSHRYTSPTGTQAQSISHTLRIKWPRLKPKLSWMRCADDVIPAWSVTSTASSSGGGGGGYHMNYGRPAGPQQCWSAVCPACKRDCSTRLCYQQLLPIALMNDSYCYTLCHAGLQHRDTWQQTLSNGFQQRMCNVWKICYLI